VFVVTESSTGSITRFKEMIVAHDDALSRVVQGHVLRTSIVVDPDGPTVGAAAAPTTCPNTVSSTSPLTPDPAPSPGSASQQPMDCDDNHPSTDDARACIRPHVPARSGWLSYVRNRVCGGTRCSRLGVVGASHRHPAGADED